MTKEEAIQHLEEMKKGIFLWDMSELIDLCISALSENKGDLISREELTKNLKSVTEWNGEIHRYIDEQGINSIPSVENKGEDRPKSHWITYRNSDRCECANCGHQIHYEYPYCPNCGADMRGGNE